MRKLVNAGRPLVAVAAAIGRWSRGQRIIASLAVFAILAAAVGGGIVTVRALAPGQSFDGDMAIGAHTWRTMPGDVDISELDDDQIEAVFCNVCHEQVVTDYSGHVGKTCLDCHAPDPDTEHVAGLGTCSTASYCHGPGDSNDPTLEGDVHASMLAEVPQPEWACLACHSEVEIAVTTIPMEPLEFTLGTPP